MIVPDSFAPFANHLWQATLFTAASILVALALGRNRAAVRYWVWLAASVKFALPFSLLIGAGELVQWRSASARTQPALVLAFDRVGQPFAPQHAIPEVAPPVHTVVDVVLPVAIALWLCGFTAVSFASFRRWRKVRDARRSASVVSIENGIPVMSTPFLIEPGVYGFFRPVFLLPDGLADRLNISQLRAIFVHESCHIRRRDNFTAAFHMAVEAVFWFHPLVWSIGRRLMEERERACDEEVVRLGSDPREYAEAILKVCKFYVESPLACVAGVSGSNLRRRIEAIVNNRTVVSLNFFKRFLLAASAVLAVAGPLLVGLLNAPPSRAQSTGSTTRKFEVATIKPNRSGQLGGGLGNTNNGRFLADNQTLEDLVWHAYGSGYWHRGLVTGGPAWVKSEHFDVMAQAEGGLATPNEMRLMLRGLLAERFQLKFHEETKDLPVFALVVARSDAARRARLRPASAAEIAYCAELTSKPPDKPAERLPDGSRRCAGSSGGGEKLRWRARPIRDLAEVLVEIVDRMVIDKTGLQGHYDIDIDLEKELDFEHLLSPDAPPPEGNLEILRVLQDQLGLKLESTKGPSPVIVIDVAERPSEN